MIIKEPKYISIIGIGLAKLSKDFESRLGAVNAGCPNILDWHAPIRSDWGTFKELAVLRSRVLFRHGKNLCVQPSS